MRSILFVCMGNICRSPLAEGVFLQMLRERGLEGRFEVDSAGTGGWHEGADPDPRSCAVATSNGVELRCTARKIRTGDWEKFDLILVMDHDNMADCLDAGAPAKKLRLLREYDPAAKGLNLSVPDPYYGGEDGFEKVYEMVAAACAGLLDELLEQSASRTENG